MLLEQFLKYPNAVFLYNLIIQEGGQIRFIGGSVRDALLNIPFNDIDFASNLTPDRIQEILEKHQISYLTMGKEFGTITAIIENDKFEITSLRKDVSCDGRHAEVEFTDSWQEDAQRRDFTINALSADLDGEIYDYFTGIDDLKQKKVRFIGNPEQRITEDYLRILRFFRFSAKYAANIDEEGLKYSSKYAQELKNISKERIFAELAKIFLAPKAVEILAIMLENNILSQILPCESADLLHLEKLHKLANIFDSKADELLCLAIFFYNKNLSPEFALSRKQNDFFKILLNSKLVDLSFTSLKQYWRKYKNNFKEVMLLNLACNFADDALTTELIKNLKFLFNKEIQSLPVSGNDLLLLDVKPGKEMGDLLLRLEEIWYDSEFKTTKDELIRRMIICK